MNVNDNMIKPKEIADSCDMLNSSKYKFWDKSVGRGRAVREDRTALNITSGTGRAVRKQDKMEYSFWDITAGWGRAVREDRTGFHPTFGRGR